MLFDMKTVTIDKLVDEINRLQKGYELLEQVYLEAGGYGEDPMTDELRYKINNFFGFDDSE
jgi:hypothetical protein